MNREERRAQAKAGNRKLVLKRILLTFEDQTSTLLDTTKVQIVDRQTGKPLFDEVLEAQPAKLEQPAETPNQEFAEEDTQKYTVEFDTPEGRMEFVKDGNWSGVRKVT